MSKQWEYRSLLAVAAVALVLVVTNIVLFNSNRAAQAETAARQDYIQRSVQLENLYREMIKALADLSVRNQDNELKNLLAAQGITVNVNAPGVAAGSSSPSQGRRK